MPALLRRHKTLTLLIAYIALSAYMISLDIRNPEQTLIIERAVMTAFGPLQRACTSAYEFASNIFETYFSLVSTNKENAKLKKSISRLKTENAQLLEAAIQNKRLRKIVKLDESRRFDSLLCSVIGVDPSKLFSSLFIDR
ncbi:MAG: hypothetical protein JW941_08400, partial [Candidatus Coatesbacteria bacterium]|nr:hypothetical protein [Candidatus Coatesbacteria bacterium]